MKVNLEGSTEAENANCLDEAINCYIQYNEYDLTNIMKEIKENMKMTVYVLKSIPYPVNNFHIWDGFYVGKTFRHQGEEYAICDTDINKAKKYKSRKRAENACNSLFEKVCNYEFEVEEIEV